MPIPNLDATGLLPSGIHECTLDEIRTRFAGWGRRREIFDAFARYLAEAHGSVVSWVAVDGSFTTGAEHPNDVDLIIVLPPEHDFTAPLAPWQSKVLMRSLIQRTYGDLLDAFVVVEGNNSFQNFMHTFQHTRDGVAKGILKVKP